MPSLTEKKCGGQLGKNKSLMKAKRQSASTVLYAFLQKWAKEHSNISIISKPSIAWQSIAHKSITVRFKFIDRDIELTVSVPKDLPKQIKRSRKLDGAFLSAFEDYLTFATVSAFYSEYEIIFEHNFANKEIITLHALPQLCRFCQKGFPETQFHKLAHAIPDSCGNKTLFTNYECDTCNQLFGNTIEDHFGRWSNANRTMFNVIGKEKAPNLFNKRGSIIPNEDVTEIKISDQSMAEFDSDQNEIRLHLINPSYIPLAVLKAFYKMALSVMPEEEFKNFSHLVGWIKGESLEPGKGVATSLLSTHCKQVTHCKSSCILLRQKSPNNKTPYMTFVLVLGQFCYQTFVTASFETQNDPVVFSPFSVLLENSLSPHSIVHLDDMNDINTRKNEGIMVTLKSLAPIVFPDTTNKHKSELKSADRKQRTRSESSFPKLEPRE